jgi:hypothetical protein
MYCEISEVSQLGLVLKGQFDMKIKVDSHIVILTIQ